MHHHATLRVCVSLILTGNFFCAFFDFQDSKASQLECGKKEGEKARVGGGINSIIYSSNVIYIFIYQNDKACPRFKSEVELSPGSEETSSKEGGDALPLTNPSHSSIPDNFITHGFKAAVRNV